MKKVEALLIDLNGTEKQIIQYLFENNQASLADLSIAIDRSEQAIRNGLNKLIDL